MSKILKIALLMALVAVAMSQTTTEEPGSGDDRFGVGGGTGKSGKGGGKSEKGGFGGGYGGSKKGGGKSEKGGYGGSSKSKKGGYGGSKSEKGGYGGSKSKKGGYGGSKSEKGGYSGKSKKGSYMMAGEQMKEFNAQSIVAVVGGVALVAGLGFFAYRRSQAKTQYEMVEITNEKDAVVLNVDASTDKTPLLQ